MTLEFILQRQIIHFFNTYQNNLKSYNLKNELIESLLRLMYEKDNFSIWEELDTYDDMVNKMAENADIFKKDIKIPNYYFDILGWWEPKKFDYVDFIYDKNQRIIIQIEKGDTMCQELLDFVNIRYKENPDLETESEDAMYEAETLAQEWQEDKNYNERMRIASYKW